MTDRKENVAPGVLIERQETVATITLNRPDTFNSVSDDSMRDALVGALDELAADGLTRAVVLTGNGVAFCAGGNVKAWKKPGGFALNPPYKNVGDYKSGIHQIPLAFERFPLPIICAINGAAIGAGCDIACMCDIRIASANAYFALAFAKMGLVPGDGGAWFLPRIVGRSKAREMLFTGDKVGAEEALSIGLVSKVVSPEKLLEVAVAMAQRIAANSPPAIRMTKQLLNESEEATLATVLTLSAAMQSVLHSTDDHHEAIAAFVEKRPAKFTGK